MQIIATVAVSLVFAVTLGFALLHYQQGHCTAAIWWGLASWIAAGVGIAAQMFSSLPSVPTEATPSEKISQRAWITVKEITFSNYLVAGQIPTVEIVIVNGGRSPALDVSIVKTIRIDVSLPDGDMPRLDGPQSVGVLGPGIEFVGTSTLNRPRTELEVATLRRRISHLYAYGIIRYRDVFNNHHWIEYCVEAIPTSPTGEAAICGKWNRTDEDRPHQ